MVLSLKRTIRGRRQVMLSAVLIAVNLTTMVVLAFTTTRTSEPLSILTRTQNLHERQWAIATTSRTKSGGMLGMTIEKEQEATASSSNSQNRNGRKRNKNRNHGMNDTGFLRKRTSQMLRVTAHDYQVEEDIFNRNGGGGSMKVDMKTFHFLIDAWAFSGEDDATDQALALLSRMEEMMDPLHPLFSKNIRPDVRSYTKVINAIARSSIMAMNKGGPELAESLLERMYELYSVHGYVACKPNTFTFTAVIESYANSGAAGMAQRAEELCEMMVQKHLEGDPDVQPTARAFNAAIHAYAKSDEPDAAQRAENLVGRMETLYESGISTVKPNSYNFNSLITAWANHCDKNTNEEEYYGDDGFPIGIVPVAATRAEEVLERMEYLYYIKGDEDSKPTTVSYNAVLDAYAKTGGDNAALKAESLLQRMEELYLEREDKSAKPNVRSYNTLLNVWAKSGHEDAANKAQDVLDHMTELYEGGNKRVRPDVHSYCTVINAWARSQKQKKSERALNLFKEMKKLYEDGKHPHLRPNVVAVNAVLNACAYTSIKKDGFEVQEQNKCMEIAHFILKDLERNPSYGNADQVTYGTFLKVCANQMPDSDTRQQVVEVIFKKCCQDGQVGTLVLNQLQHLASEELYHHLIGVPKSEQISMEDLPTEWWCHVVEGKWRRRNRQ